MAFQIALVSLGWDTSATTTTPGTTPASVQNLRATHIPLAASQPVDPYVYIDKSTRGFPGNLIYETEIKFFPGPFDFSTAGELISHNVDLWTMHDPKFVKCTDQTWVDRLGNGWVKVTATKYTLDKSSGQNAYTLKIKVASPVTLT